MPTHKQQRSGNLAPASSGGRTDTHTPGPWTTRPAKYCGDIAIVAIGEDAMLAECFEDIRTATEHNRAECEANARLIAATPDLLEALEAMCDAQAQAVREANARGEAQPACIALAAERARHILAKARGQDTPL